MKRLSLILSVTVLFVSVLAGCSQPEDEERGNNSPLISSSQNNGSLALDSHSDTNTAPAATELEVHFGDDGAPFVMHLYDNETAEAIARYVGTADWRLPIYHYDDYDHWEVMQYYDIPSRYEIPSSPETVTSEKAGEVYYSEPNRIVLFFGDAEVTGEYTKIGYFTDTEDFREAVEQNPALEGWGNKIIRINSVNS